MSGTPTGKEPFPPLLRLPPLLRHRIYRFLDLASWDGSPYIFDLHGGWSFGDVTPYPRTFRGLLLSCRAIYAEAAALLYSANRFVVHYTNPGSLAPLLSLTALALSSLGALKIVLNHASCHQQSRFRICCLHYRGWSHCQMSRAHDHRHQLPLLSPAPGYESDDDPSAAAQALVSEWHIVASHLSSFITSRSLDLSLVCDIDPQHEQAVNLANLALAPLRLLPLLRSCHLRLGKTPDLRLSQIAQDAVLESCGISAPYLKPTSTKATFLALPRELRVRILEFTDLVTPNKEVWWCREDSKYTWRDIGGHSQCDDDTFGSPCKFLECWYRTAMVGSSIGCFCRYRHAASSTTCICWVPPGSSLFLVCQAICQDAQLVFFSANRFIVHDLTGTPWSLDSLRGRGGYLRSEYPFQRLAASQFLREVIPTHCIAYLRFLELVFPPYFPATWPQMDHLAMQDWRETVGWLQDKINGPALTLRLVGAHSSSNGPDSPYTDTITVAEGDTIHRGYMELLQPLEQLTEGPNGLARFYADLRYPWQWTDESRNRPDSYEWVEARKRSLERMAERRVMGDRYDSQYANGRKEPGKSLWRHTFYDHH